MKVCALFVVALVALPLAPPSAQAESDVIVVVVNKANPASVLSGDVLRPIFQTVKTEWSDGSKAVPVNLPDDDPLRQKFDAGVLGLDPDRVSRYWIDRKVRGGERPPQRVSSESAVLRFVASNRGGVGYVKASAADSSVKIVARVENGRVVGP
jgi:ABC-type phosphate transport system substrate-binding protein